MSDQQELNFSHLGMFNLTKVLNEIPERRFIALLGTFPSVHSENKAIVILDKTPFIKEQISNILTEKSKLEIMFKNDSYGKYDCQISPENNLVKVNLIYPATDKHIEKYSDCPSYLVEETPQVYNFFTKPFIENTKFDITWVINILEHKKEADTIIVEDEDPADGFVLVPDYKWNGKQTDDMYLLCLIHRRGLGSIRDLNATHLPMLRNIWRKSTKAIFDKYKVTPSQLRAYFHYHPSYYHLHIHFVSLKYEVAGSGTEKAHLLQTVIRNIEMVSDYYSKATLPFVVKENDKLYEFYVKNGYDFNTGQAKCELDNKKLIDFFMKLGIAKHEPCGEHWNLSYGDSAWRMAIMILCLPEKYNRKRLIKVALTAGFTSMGESTVHCCQWKDKLESVRLILKECLSPEKASYLFELFSTHANARRGLNIDTEENAIYRKVVELEELLLQWEELCNQGEEVNTNIILKKMAQIGFYGSNQFIYDNNPTELNHLLKFFADVTKLTHLKRKGWVLRKVHDPERVSGHMFRMGLMATVLEENTSDEKIFKGSSVILTIIHDIAECIVGDITPVCGVSDEDKHEREMAAMKMLTGNLPQNLAREFRDAFNRYELQDVEDKEAILTKDLDKFDMILQAYEYEQNKVQDRPEKYLQEFFDSTKNVFKTDKVKSFVNTLNELRDA